MNNEYQIGLAKETGRVIKSHPSLYDHRPHHPWLIGSLGDPTAGIWFVAENPSLTQVERVRVPNGGELTIETQWSGSRGDKLFREMLVQYGFKTGSVESPDGWKCYITNVIKEADYTKNWREKSQTEREKAAEIWSSVFNWELKNSNPKLVVLMGGQANLLMNHLVSIGKIKLPRVEQITHYAYIGQRAQGHLGPMHPQRIEAYSKEFARIRKVFDSLM